MQMIGLYRKSLYYNAINNSYKSFYLNYELIASCKYNRFVYFYFYCHAYYIAISNK